MFGLLWMGVKVTTHRSTTRRVWVLIVSGSCPVEDLYNRDKDLPRRVMVTSLLMNPPPILHRSASSSVRRLDSGSSGASAALRQSRSHRACQLLFLSPKQAKRFSSSFLSASNAVNARVRKAQRDLVVIAGMGVFCKPLDGRLGAVGAAKKGMLMPGAAAATLLRGGRAERDRARRDVERDL